MNTAACIDDARPGGSWSARPKKPLSPWITILSFLAGLLIFMFIIGPWGLETETMKPITQTIEDYGIEANAYYYTEVPEFADAQVFFSNNRRYPSRK